MATIHISSIGENVVSNVSEVPTIAPTDGHIAMFDGTTGKLQDGGSTPAGITIVFPDADPHVAGAAYWVSGTLTKSAG